MMTKARLFERALEIAAGRTGNICYHLTVKQGNGMTGVLVSIRMGADGYLRRQAVECYLSPFTTRTLEIEEYSLADEMLEDDDGRSSQG